MMTSPKDFAAINELTKVTIDSVDGYRKAADEAENHSFQSIFYDRANERAKLVSHLQEFVRVRGEEPETDGSVGAGAHRMFMGLRDAIMGKDDDAIIAEVERGEDHLKEKYDEARARDDLSSEAQVLIAECYTSVKVGHDQMRDLKHGVSPQSTTMPM